MFSELGEDRFGPPEIWRHHHLVAIDEAVDDQVMTVDLPSPGLGRRRLAENANLVIPLVEFIRAAGNFTGVMVQLHDIARGLVTGGT